MSVKDKIDGLLKALNVGIYEKEDALRLALLSSIAGESIFLLGPPGVAKSLIARRLKFAFTSGTVFEYLMSRFSTPDEIFGPVSISKLKNDDKYERVIEHYLPSASVVFLDEIWKAGPSIQNALLTVLNEKVFRNGDAEIKVPMKALISASNELPAKDEGLEALWDRFLVRLYVDGVQDRDNFESMLTDAKAGASQVEIDENLQINDDEYTQWNKAINEVEVPSNVLNAIDVIRHKIAEFNEKDGNAENQIYVSDRRWRKIVRLLRTSAFLNDRKEVDLMDCFLITDCIWDNDTQIDTSFQFVREAIEQYGYTVDFDFQDYQNELNDFRTEIDEETKYIKEVPVQVLMNARKDYYEIQNPPNQNSTLIRQLDYDNLNNSNKGVMLYYWHQSYQNVQQYSAFNIRKGNSDFSIFINEKEYQLKTTTKKEQFQGTKKPHPAVEKEWDERVSQFWVNCESMREEIANYKDKDLKNLRINLFVSPEYANIVETHIDWTIKDIDKLELDIKEIQNIYKRLKDEDVELSDDIQEDVENA
jgi:MoxR-like ATPase